MYEQIRYEESFLKEVIVRVDFSSPIQDLVTGMPTKIGNAALARFPVSEPRKGLAQELQLSKEAVQHKQQEFTEWNYYGRDREKRLVVAPMMMFVSYSCYSTYETLKGDFLSVLSSLFATFRDVQASRLGLRYINQIEHPIDDPFHWNDFIDQRLLGLFSRFNEREHVTRLFNIAEFKYDDLQVKFQFGAPNPDYPATIRRPVFVLDFDGYVQGLQELNDVEANMERAHKRIQSLFEESITNGLREVMSARRS